MPKLVTSTMTKSLRAGKVFLDWSQNSGSKTTIAPYSLRGREHPTVAAPRTWEELDDPALRQLRYDEVLARVARDGDLLAALDADVRDPDRLTKYRSMRDAAKTPEPVPKSKPATGQGNTFVIQEHHARRLHYDFRLERDGVLVSWAVPKNLPETTSVNHLAVHTEDHPLEYGAFEGNIPKGEYGAGKVIIWDSGTYETEKFSDRRKRGGHRHSARQPDLRALRADSDQRRPVAGAPDEGSEGLRVRRDRPHARDARFGGGAEGRPVGLRRQVGRLPAAGRGRPRRRCGCGRAADATSPANIPNCAHWQRISPTTTSVLDGEVVALTRPVCPASTRCRTAAAPPASSTGHSTCSTWMAVRCCGPSTKTGASYSKPWPMQAISSFPSCCPVTAPRRSSTRASTAGRAWSPRGATPPTSRAGARRRGSRTSIGTPRKS